MNKLFTYMLLYLFVINLTAQSIANKNVTNHQTKKQVSSTGFSISISSGITNPTGDYQKYTQEGKTEETVGFPINFLGYTNERTGKSQYNLDLSYQFSKFGAGVSIGQFNHEMSSLLYDIDFPTILNGGDIDGLYYGVGPDYHFSFGKIDISSMLRAGMMQIDMTDLSGSYNGTDTDIPIELLQTTLNPDSETNLMYTSLGVKISYLISKKISIFTKIDYISSLGDGLLIDNSYFLPFDVNGDNLIDIEDIPEFTNRDYLVNESRFIKPKMLNLGIGFSYSLGVNKTKPKNKSINNNAFVENKNPKNDNDELRKIQLLSPNNGSQFDEKRELKKFTWKVIGKPFIKPNYIIEVRELKQRGHIYLAQTKETSISSKEIFKDIIPSGQYTWKVTERETGSSSGMNTITFNNCDVNMSIDNVDVECLGYVDSDRKYQICFDVTYSSSVGDLTYVNPGSGLSVFDQSYNSLGYNLTGANTTLQTQIGATQSTVHYCFETLVDTTVTSIGFGLQGDDLDPSPLICQPGVSNGIDELPSCLCDECDTINIDLNNFTISPNQQNASIYNFNGNLNVNTPIYGVEFQLISMNYTSNPNACSSGVNSVESSGMFLQTGTTINNSSSIQFINESASQSPNSNNSASKNIVYQSSSALNSAIPINLNIGLPQPLQGLNSGCCQIDYKVCLKVKVFYEDGSCKTCFTTQCFNFNNQ